MFYVKSKVSDFGMIENETYLALYTDGHCARVVLRSGFETTIAMAHLEKI